MERKLEWVWISLLIVSAASLGGCQKATTASSSTLDVDDFVDSTVTPSPATATASTDGRTYRVVRGNNQPDDILEYKYKTSFEVTLKVNSNATDDDVDLEFPVEITSINAKVEQASGGIVTVPTGGDVEHYDSVISQTSGKAFAAVNGTVTFRVDVWYTLPSGGKEALITTSIACQDDDSQVFTKAVKVNVAP